MFSNLVICVICVVIFSPAANCGRKDDIEVSCPERPINKSPIQFMCLFRICLDGACPEDKLCCGNPKYSCGGQICIDKCPSYHAGTCRNVVSSCSGNTCPSAQTCCEDYSTGCDYRCLTVKL